MTIVLNNKAYEAEPGTTLASFIESLGIPSQGIAIAIGYEVVPKEEWDQTVLTDKIELMLIHAVSGG